MLLFRICSFIYILFSATHSFPFTVITEDTAVATNGAWEINAYLCYTRDSGEYSSGSFQKYASDTGSSLTELELDIRRGIINNNLNFGICIPYVYLTETTPASKDRATGMGDISLFGKISILDNLAMLAGVNLPTGSTKKDIGCGKTEPYFSVIGNKSINNLDFYAGAGIQCTNPILYTYSFAANLNIHSKTELVFEAIAETDKNYAQITNAFGVTYELLENRLSAAFALQTPIYTSGSTETYLFMPHIGITLEY